MVRALALALVLAFGALTALAGEATVAARDAWSRALPPVAKVGAAYLVLENRAGAADALLGASASVAGRVEIHSHEMDGGMMRMRRLERVPLPPGEMVTFAPHGLHLMLFDLAGPLVAGERFTVRLRFAHAAPVTVEVAIRE